MNQTPYDHLPYRCQPIEWTAPERLALASRLHGGPAPDLRQYRVLELGCGDGSNLLPMAYYRPQSEFYGIDSAATQIDLAQSRKTQLKQDNIRFFPLDFCQADDHLEGKFDFIIVHGVFSWVPDSVRDALFVLCQQRLTHNGLLYLNYNTKPGWNIRGMVRDYLLAHTGKTGTLQQRALQAQHTASKMAQLLSQPQASEAHPFSTLLANEFRFVCENHYSYVAHEFLAEHNKAYWRSEFMALAEHYGLYPIADADYNYPSGKVDAALPQQLLSQALTGPSLEDSVDLISYRQLHTPILSKQQAAHPSMETSSLIDLHVASCLQPVQPHWYQHPNGYQVEVKNAQLAIALERLFRLWPASAPIATILDQSQSIMEDLLLLHNNGLVELRLPEAPRLQPDSAQLNPLNQQELQWGGYFTTASHQRVTADLHSATAGHA